MTNKIYEIKNPKTKKLVSIKIQIFVELKNCGKMNYFNVNFRHFTGDFKIKC